jgi:two-component system OmpR family response regulator
MSQTILVVDDFAGVRLYHMSFLTRKGYRCIGACNGEEALAQLRDHHVDLVLLDMVMPGMDGNAFLDQLSASPALATLPGLVITTEEPVAQGSSSGSPRPTYMLSKPVVPGALLRRVQQLLPPSQSAPLPEGGV